MKPLIAVVCMLLGACASKPEVIYQDRPVEVKVEVVKPCLKKEQLPKKPELQLDTVELTGQYATAQAINAARADRIATKAYIKDASALLEACAQ